MKKLIFLVASFFFLVFFSFAENSLILHQEDIKIVWEEGKTFENSEGYHLYIRKKNNIESVMLTETTKDPSGKTDNYAYRALEYNPDRKSTRLNSSHVF